MHAELLALQVTALQAAPIARHLRFASFSEYDALSPEANPPEYASVCAVQVQGNEGAAPTPHSTAASATAIDAGCGRGPVAPTRITRITRITCMPMPMLWDL